MSVVSPNIAESANFLQRIIYNDNCPDEIKLQLEILTEPFTSVREATLEEVGRRYSMPPFKAKEKDEENGHKTA